MSCSLHIGILDPVLVPPVHGTEEGFGALETERGRLPLEAMDVDGEISGLLVRIRLDQSFVNVFSTSLEATYIFPLPARHGVTRFRMRVAGRVLEGVLKERGEARREYDQALRNGHRAAIAEEERPEVFTMRVGNIPPGERVSIELELSGPVPFADGEATFRFPLVVAQRYIPGAPIDGPSVGSGTASDTSHVRDASRITPPVRLPGMPNPVRLSFGLTLERGGLEIADIRSSLHEVRAADEGGGKVRVWLEPGERLDRDFILRYRIGGDGVRTGMLVHREQGAEEGTFALTVVPPTLAQMGTAPRDVVVLLDRSGSMAGWRITAACRAAGRLVDSLTIHDRFALLAFDNHVDDLVTDAGVGLIPASDRNRFRALQALGTMSARGGTEMAGALQRAVRTHTQNSMVGRQQIVILVTDGQVGNESQLLSWMAQNGTGIRTFTVGIDRAVNAAFLERLAAASGGTSELVESEDRLDEVMQNVFRRVGSPVLTGLIFAAAKGMNLVLESFSPGGEVDVFPGVPAVVRGRFRGEPTEVMVRGRTAGGELHDFHVTPVTSVNPALRVAWARSRLLDLEHRYVADGGKDRVVAKQITDFSLAHGVLCRFTAFVVVDRSEVVSPGGPGHRITQSVEPADGWEMHKKVDSAPFLAMERLAESGPRSAPAPSLSAKMYDDMLAPRKSSRPSGISMSQAPRACAEIPPERPLEAPSITVRGAATIGDMVKNVGDLLRGLIDWMSPEVPEVTPIEQLRRVVGDSLDKWFGKSTGTPPFSDPQLRQRLSELVHALQGICPMLGSKGPELATLARRLEQLLEELKGMLQSTEPLDRARLESMLARLDLLAKDPSGSTSPPSGAKRDEDFWM